ncbi:ammonium transporter Rh type B-like [Saccoglossus kowalevskii]|uniref:Ammonium transporter Rh type B-like n=1 Tax=Saccoglossus kowalevskii TaxID=10224 RepID=A0ABM0MX08_SACKO|nr:PREDICTED: ammonium transporter Rh type B-like [Saccoglossus kowalevskii]
MAQTVEPKRRRGKLTLVLVIFQIIFLVLFGIFVEYGEDSDAKAEQNNLEHGNGGADAMDNRLGYYYPMFQDVHVMIFIGFGFLMTFLKRYGFGSVGYNFLLAAFVIQWATLMQGFLHLHHGKIQVGVETMLTSDFAAAAVLISFGALLGKVSHLQLIILGFVEIIFFSVNEYVGAGYFQTADVGGSMFVHVFGAYFGLAASRVLNKKSWEGSSKEGSVYHSDLFAMIGTVFLWMFWPSFNSALAPGDDQHRAVINTYYALASCCVTTFAVSAMVSKENKLDMVHIQNSTLAGGVAVGTCANMMIQPWGAMVIGVVAGTLSVVGYKWISPFLLSKVHLHDTCGVNNLHGMPGILAAIAGAIAAATAETSNYGYGLYEVFPARAPLVNSTALDTILDDFTVDAGSGRTAGMQAGFQLVALVITLAIAIISGMLTGLLLKIPILDQLTPDELYDDNNFWEVPEEDTHYVKVQVDDQMKGSMDELNGATNKTEKDTKM